jgi:hypothetical protein
MKGKDEAVIADPDTDNAKQSKIFAWKTLLSKIIVNWTAVSLTIA